MAITYTKSAIIFDSSVLLPGTAFHYQSGVASEGTWKEGNGILTYCDSDYITLNFFDVHKEAFQELTVLLTDYLAGKCELQILTYMDGSKEKTGAEVTDITPPAEVTDLAETHNHTQVTFTFDKPTDLDYSHSRLLQDGAVVADNITLDLVTVTGLQPLTAYSFLLQTVDTNGNTSVGTDFIVVTEAAPDLTPPGEVSSIVVSEITGTSAKLTWSEPTDLDYSHSKVTIEGTSTVLNNILTGEVELTALTASTNYTIRIQTVDTVGNTSTGVTQTFTTT